MPAASVASAEIAVSVEIGKLRPAEWNANRVSASMLAKVRRSIERFGFVEGLVARAHPTERGCYEVLSGNHRLKLALEMGFAELPVVLVKVGDAEARLLAQALNRTRGVDDRVKYARLLDEILGGGLGRDDVAGLLPETESSIERILQSIRPAGLELDAASAPPARPKSLPGRVYNLGPHRLMCGDATNPAHVERLLAGETPGLLATDPPYGVSVDHTWRDGRVQSIGAARTARVTNDDRFDWTEAYRLVGAPVAYVWHASQFGSPVQANLEAAGYAIRQQIIWVKTNAPLSRSAYHWAHEPCWYAVLRGARASWIGDRKQTTVWEYPSPIAALGSGGGVWRPEHRASDAEAGRAVRALDPEPCPAGGPRV